MSLWSLILAGCKTQVCSTRVTAQSTQGKDTEPQLSKHGILVSEQVNSEKVSTSKDIRATRLWYDSR